MRFSSRSLGMVTEWPSQVRSLERRRRSPRRNASIAISASFCRSYACALPGVHGLFAFLLAVPFQQNFTKITEFQKRVYFATLLLHRDLGGRC